MACPCPSPRPCRSGDRSSPLRLPARTSRSSTPPDFWSSRHGLCCPWGTSHAEFRYEENASPLRAYSPRLVGCAAAVRFARDDVQALPWIHLDVQAHHRAVGKRPDLHEVAQLVGEPQASRIGGSRARLFAIRKRA